MVATKLASVTAYEKASRLLNLARNVPPLVAMSSPPTVTVGNTTSTITNSVHTLPASDKFTVLGTAAVVHATALGGYPSDLLFAGNIEVTPANESRVAGNYKQGGRLRVSWGSDAPILEIGVGGGTGRYRLFVDGVPISIAGTAAPADFAYHYIKFDFTTSAHRSFVLECEKYVEFGGVRVGPSYSVWKTAYDPLRLMMVCDSYGDGVGADSYLNGFSCQVGLRLGVQDTWINAESSIGYLQDGLVSEKLPSEKLTGDVIAYAPDWVAVCLGINDIGKTPSTLQSTVTTYFQNMLTALPNTIVTVMGPWRAPSQTPAQNISDAIKAGVQAQAGYGGRIMFYDTFAEGWQSTGAGKVGATSGNGNSNIYISSDGVHPVQAGHDYLAARTASAIKRHAALLAA